MNDTRLDNIMRLHETACELLGARKVLMRLRDQELLVLSKGVKPSKDDKVYTNAVYDLLLHDEKALFEWLAGVDCIRFYDHECDKKGKLIRCKAKRI